MLIMETLLAAAHTRLVATGFAGGNLLKHRDPPTTADELPLAGITYDNDDAKADGDPRTGTSDFQHKLTLVIDVLDTGVDGAATMTKLALHSEHIMRALCVDPWNWSADVVEGIDGVRNLTEKSPEGAEIVYRRQVQVDILYRSQWDPNTDAIEFLETVSVDAGNGAGAVFPVP